jgi:hypothetical protein
MREALAALERHGSTIKLRDRIVIADFSAPSSQPRFHFIDLVSGKSVSKLVAHGSGSDPGHTGFLQRFSNKNGSNASCEGAFLADNYYVGKHGKSQRLSEQTRRIEWTETAGELGALLLELWSHERGRGK